MDSKKIRTDLVLATGTQVFVKLVGYIVITILVRYLSKDEMGVFLFAASLATFFALFTSMGTAQYLIREVSEKPQQALKSFSRVFSLRLILQVIFFFILNGFVYLTKPDILETVILTSIYVFLEDLYFTVSLFFLGLRQVIYRTITHISAKILLLGLILLVTRFKVSLNLILVCFILANLFLIIFSLLVVWFKDGRFYLYWNRTVFIKILRISFPFFIITFLSSVQLNIDTLMLGYMRSYSTVATYTTGAKLFEVSQFVIRPIPMVFFPISAGLIVHQNWNQAKNLFQKLLLVTGVFGIIVTILVLITADLAVSIIFGDAYFETTQIVRVLFLSVPFLFMGVICLFYSNALHIESKAMWVLVVGVLCNITLNFIGIYYIGIVGAAWSTVISQTIITIALIILNFRYLLAGKQQAALEAQPLLLIDE